MSELSMIGARQMRTIESKFSVRETSDSGDPEKRIEGYFAVFDGRYDLDSGCYETVDRHAFDGTLGGDIRALTNHDTTLVLGRTAAQTLALRVDDHGLWGSILINPNDQDALNLWERVKRGDVSQCSFGFDIVREDTEILPDGTVHWTIREVKLYEVSVCTFPAYESTAVQARTAEAEKLKAKRLEGWRAKVMSQHEWLGKGE